MSNNFILKSASQVKSCFITICQFNDDVGESAYNAIIHMLVEIDTNESIDLPIISEIYHPTMSGAIYLAAMIALGLTEHLIDDVHVIDEAGESIAQLSVGDVVRAVKDEVDAMHETVPVGTTIH